MKSHRKIEDETLGLLKDTEVGPNYDSIVGGSTKVLGGSTFIEPVMFLLMLAEYLSESVIANLLEYRTCKLELGLSDSNCVEPISTVVEDLVQPTTAHVIMSREVIDALITSCLNIFIGPWSDKNGRKFFLITALSGMLASYVCWGCMALLPWLHPQAFLLTSLPLILTSGTSTIFLLIYCYISDVTDEQSLPLRMSLLAIADLASSLVGFACAPVLLSVQNTVNPYPLVFFLSSFLILVAIIYTSCYIRESVNIKPNRDKRLLQFSHVKSLCNTCFKYRGDSRRTIALMIALVLTINVSITSGEHAIMYLSTREMFSWQLADFTIFQCFDSFLRGSGCLCGVWLLTSVLGLSNMISTILLLFTLVTRSVILATAHSGLQFYLSSVITIFTAAYVPLCQTELTTLIPKEDSGKMFALIAFLESVSPMVSAPLYTYVYEATFLEKPSLVYWLSAILSAISFSVIIVVSIKQRKMKEPSSLMESESIRPSHCNGSIDK